MCRVSYFRDLWSDTRRLLGGQRDLLTISLVAALSIAVSYNRFLRLPGVSGDLRAAVEIVGRSLLFLIPPLISLAVLRIPLREMGFGWGEARKWSRDILLAYIIMLPLLITVSRRPDFRLTYCDVTEIT